jgi:fructose-1,6-bisphosphatase-3
MQVRKAFDHELSPADRKEAIDYFLYLWCGPDSPLFNKSKMTTFERYWIADKATHEEKKGVYYELRDDPKVVDYILDIFGVEGKDRHIINGHVPVHASRGEDPIKADGKLLVIDGGISESYHKETGIAGYTLVYHSKMMELVQHEAFTTVADAVAKELDIKGTKHLVEWKKKRMLVRDTDTGRELQKQINNLWQLLEAYRSGVVREKAVLK